jgi:DNA polymerase-3 subunit delta
MGALSFDALLRSLKHGAPNPVYYLHGDEDVLKDEAIRALIERAVEPGARDFNVDQRSANSLDVEAFHALVDTLPLLAPTRAVILRGVEQVKKTSSLYKEVLRYIDAPNPTTVLILVQSAGEDPDGTIAREATAVGVERLAPDRVVRWVAHRAGMLGLTLDPQATTLLLDVAGHDLGTLARELDKLAAVTGSPAAASPGRPATEADIAALVGARHGETIGDLVQATMEVRPAAAVRLVEPVLAQPGVTGVRIVTTLGAAFIGTALARAELDGGVRPARLPDVVFRHLLAARPYGLGNWKDEAARWARWASLWHLAALRHAIRCALAADEALKTSRLSDDAALVSELLLMATVAVREAA